MNIFLYIFDNRKKKNNFKLLIYINYLFQILTSENFQKKIEIVLYFIFN